MTTIGRYHIENKLGEGGMGVVYRARDPLLDRVIALKLLSGSVEGNPDLRERFYREARAAGQLSHRNVITIHDLGEHEGRPYLAMEYLEGEDLQRWLQRRIVMSLARKLQLVVEVCEGLEYAHARGVIHRDIKPGNIFLTSTGAVKLLDFGLARLVTSELTHSNMMLGTLNYMAPEQVRGERADHRSDIFSMGVVLYELLAGRKAFEGDSFASTLYKILQETPEPLTAIDPSLPPDLVAIVERALSKSREERYQHVGELLRDLLLARQRFELQSSPAVPLSSPPPGETPTIPGTPSPVPVTPSRPSPASPPGPTPSPSETQSSADRGAAGPRGDRRVWIAASLGALLTVAAIGGWLALRPSPVPVPVLPAAGPDEAELDAQIERAELLLRAGDYDAALREAADALTRAPDHEAARRLHDRARETADAVAASVGNARAHYEAGRYEQAISAAGEALALAPGNADAKRLMEDSSARTRGRTAEIARRQVAQARAAAVAARAPALAPAAFGAAVQGEQEALRLLTAGHTADASVKLYETIGLFRSAALAARTAAADEQRAGTSPPAQPRAAPESSAAAAGSPADRRDAVVPAPPAPEPTASHPRGVPTVPAVTAPHAIPGASQPPAPPPTPPPAAQTPPPKAVPEQAIRDVLARYQAALEGRSLDALRRIWPALGGPQEAAIASDFRNATRIDVQIREPQILVSGATASVRFTRRYEMLTTDGQRLRTETATVMTLRRESDAWLIADIRFEPSR